MRVRTQRVRACALCDAFGLVFVKWCVVTTISFSDKFYHLAKEQGFRSRASFKLIQLNKKYDLLSKARVVLDLCGAPGSWSQVCSKTCPTSSMIVCVDIVKIAPLPNVICLQEDITTEKCKAAIKKHIKTFKVDLVLNDGAPNVGQNWSKDAYNQSELTLEALKLATQFLAVGGNFVTKVFRSQDYNALLWVLNQLFKRVEASKPQASRNESAEIFVVCLGYLAPKKIDPKLLDPKHVFAEIDTGPAKKANVLQKEHSKKHRDGYEAGVTVLYKEISATDFVRSEDAVQVLSDHNKIVFVADREEDQALLEHEKTDAEIKNCFMDLRVLGKGDFRRLLRWRDAVKAVVCAPEEEEEEAEEEAESEMDEDEKFARQVGDLKKAAAARDKRRKRKEREKKARNQKRIDLKMDIVGDQLETQTDLGLFALSDKSKKALGQETDHLADKLAENGDFSDSAEDDVEKDSEDEADLSPGEREERRLRKLDEEMDSMYSDYLDRTGATAKEKKRKRRRGGDEDDLDAFVPDMSSDINDADKGADADSEEAGEDEEEAGVDAENGSKDSKTGFAMSRWFSQPIFSQLQNTGGAPSAAGAASADSGNSGKKSKKGDGKGGARGKANAKAGVEGPELPAHLAAGSGTGGGAHVVGEAEEEDTGFEEVAASDSDPSSMDSEEEAECAAMGSLLLKKKIRKEELIDACYHRYSFNDSHLAPKWFQDDQKKFTKGILPVTKEQIAEERARNMEIAARPIKKVMEAKARKKIKLVRAGQKASNKADQISNDSDLSDKVCTCMYVCACACMGAGSSGACMGGRVTVSHVVAL